MVLVVIIISMIIIIPNILISIGKQCLRAKKGTPERETERWMDGSMDRWMDEWMCEGADAQMTGPEGSLENV